MKSKAGILMMALRSLIIFVVMGAVAAYAADTGAPEGAPPSGDGAPAVDGDGPPAASGVVLSITFLGNKTFTSEQLQAVVDGTDLKIGGPVGFTIIAPVMKALLDFYHNNGQTLNISPNIIEDPKGIVFVQFIIDENGTRGDVGGLVSSGGPHIFCE